MEKSLVITVLLGVALAVGMVHGHAKLTQNNFCGHDCSNNICRDVENNTALPNEASCNQFFICVDGNAQPNTCPNGQWFNANTSHCDSGDNPDCKEDVECPEKGIHFFPHEKYCDKYYMCFDGTPILSHCSDGLYFDRNLKTCNLPEFAECIWEVCPPYNDVDNIVFLPSDVDCEKYYICFDGEPLEFWCPPGIHWNPATDQCDMPENANCTIPPRDDEYECEPPHEVECPCKDSISFIPHPKNCEWFFICSQGQSALFRCAPGFWFDPISNWCDLPELVQCEAAGTTTTPRPCDGSCSTRPPCSGGGCQTTTSPPCSGGGCSTTTSPPCSGGGCSTTTSPPCSGGGCSTSTSPPCSGGGCSSTTTTTRTPCSGGGCSTTTSPPCSGGGCSTSTSPPCSGGGCSSTTTTTRTPCSGGGCSSTSTTTRTPCSGGGCTPTTRPPCTGDECCLCYCDSREKGSGSGSSSGSSEDSDDQGTDERHHEHDDFLNLWT